MDLHELKEPEGRVILFQIPAASKGFPVAFAGHYYGRDDDELSPLNLEEIERIRAQAAREDWSAVIIPDATIHDLDDEAIALARRNFKNKFPDKAEEVDKWDNITFLNKAKVTILGKILDMNYAQLLSQHKDLTLDEIIMLDKIQKKKKLTKSEEKHLKHKKWIEGRKPNYFIGLKVAQKTGQKATYSKNKAFDKSYYLDLIKKSN